MKRLVIVTILLAMTITNLTKGGIFSTDVFAAVLPENTALYGDETFLIKVKEIEQSRKEEISDNSIFVATNGNDKNSGTIDAPYKTINAALDNAKAGTTVYVREGVYTENIYFPNNGNAQKGYITLCNYPNEKPVLKGTGKNDKAIIELDGHDYIHIQGFEMCDYTAKWCYGIIFAGGENHIIINDNSIHDIKCSKPSDPDNSGANGILLFGETKEPISNVYISNNHIYNLVTGWCEALSITANCEYVNVINNTIENCTNIGIDFYGNNADGYCPIEELNQPRYCVAAGNTVSGCVCDYATCYGIYVDGARDIVVENNFSFNNQGGIEIGSEELNKNYPVKNIVVRNNVVYNNTENGITVGGWNDGSSKEDALSGVVYNVQISNNTVVGNSKTGSGQLHFAMVDGVDCINNIFVDKNNAPLVASDVKNETIQNISFKNNIYYSTVADTPTFELYNAKQIGMEQWKTLSGENGEFTDPLLNDDYSLNEKSSAVDKGAEQSPAVFMPKEYFWRFRKLKIDFRKPIW